MGQSKDQLRQLKPFENKIWLSSPTMHGEELGYITEAYKTSWGCLNNMDKILPAAWLGKKANIRKIRTRRA